jgi:hypothetical protein
VHLIGRSSSQENSNKGGGSGSRNGNRLRASSSQHVSHHSSPNVSSPKMSIFSQNVSPHGSFNHGSYDHGTRGRGLYTIPTSMDTQSTHNSFSETQSTRSSCESYPSPLISIHPSISEIPYNGDILIVDDSGLNRCSISF